MSLISGLTLLVQVSLFFLILSIVFRASPITLMLRMVDQIGRNVSGAPVLYLSQITPQLYIGGQHKKHGWEKMQALGITAIVNMREIQYDDRAQGIAPEDYLHLPTVDGTAPTLAQLHTGVAFISEKVTKGDKVYIHCASGFHRAPTMASAYLMATGLSLNEALAKIKKVRPFARPIPVQKKQLEIFATELPPKSNFG